MTTEPEARETVREPTPLPIETKEAPPKSDTMRLIETLSGLAATLAAAKRADRRADRSADHPERAAYVTVPHDVSEPTEAPEPPEPEITLPGVAGLAEAIAALDAPVETPLAALPHPLDVPYAEPEDRTALETVSVATPDEPEPIVALVEEDGAIVATQPGGEPVLDAADALPTPPAPFPTGEGGAVGAHSRAPSRPDVPSTTAAALSTQHSALAKVRAGDVVGAIGAMRAALTAAGTDRDQLHALLPALRALVDATPRRPDSRRLLGDAYTRLGLYAQAQGQYRQALLVRVAGKGAGR